MQIKFSDLNIVKYFYEEMWNEFYDTQYKKKSKEYFTHYTILSFITLDLGLPFVMFQFVVKSEV